MVVRGCSAEMNSQGHPFDGGEAATLRKQLCSLLLEQMGQRGGAVGAPGEEEHSALRLVREFVRRRDVAGAAVEQTPCSVFGVSGSATASVSSRKRKKPINPMLLQGEQGKKIIRALLMSETSTGNSGNNTPRSGDGPS